MQIRDLATYLFVPGDRPDRFPKAIAAGSDAVIIDLEDAVAPPAKAVARDGLLAGLAGISAGPALFVRINAVGTDWHGADLRMAARLPLAGIVLPKAESADAIDTIRRTAAFDVKIVALVETAKGIQAVDEIARSADWLAFGSVDFAADLGCRHSREALLLARNRLVLAARLANKPAPIDGVTLTINDPDTVEDDARYAATLGFTGKLLIHPSQIAPARRGLAPGDEEFSWASAVLARAGDGSARAIDGVMVDAPVLERARQIVRTRMRLLGEIAPGSG